MCGGRGFLEKGFYGSATVGDRGQIVIPAEAREELGFAPGDKVLVMRHPIHDGLVVFKLEKVREFLDDFRDRLDQAEASMSGEGDESK